MTSNNDMNHKEDVPRPSLKCGDGKQSQHGFWDVVVIKGVVCPLPLFDHGLVNFSRRVINVLTSVSIIIRVHFIKTKIN